MLGATPAILCWSACNCWLPSICRDSRWIVKGKLLPNYSVSWYFGSLQAIHFCYNSSRNNRKQKSAFWYSKVFKIYFYFVIYHWRQLTYCITYLPYLWNRGAQWMWLWFSEIFIFYFYISLYFRIAKDLLWLGDPHKANLATMSKPTLYLEKIWRLI